jgi:hypothetical protein
MAACFALFPLLRLARELILRALSHFLLSLVSYVLLTYALTLPSSLYYLTASSSTKQAFKQEAHTIKQARSACLASQQAAGSDVYIIIVH